MKPEPRRERSRSNAIARGRMFMKAHLGWLPGFPVSQDNEAVNWISLPRYSGAAPQLICIQREQLQQASYTWSKLVHRFPNVLTHLVDDKQHWLETLPQLFEQLKQAIHHEQKLLSSTYQLNHGFSRNVVETAQTIAQQHPQLQPLLQALSWLTWLSPQELAPALNWLQERAEAIETLLITRPNDGVLVVLTLSELTRRDGYQRTDIVLKLLSNPIAFNWPIQATAIYFHHCKEVLQNAIKRKFRATRLPLPSRPPPELGPSLLEFINELLAQRQGVRRRTLDLFILLMPDDLLPEWQVWWLEVESLLKQARRLIALPPESNNNRQQQLQALIVGLQDLQQQQPLNPHINALLAVINNAAKPENIALQRALCALLKHLPQRQENRLVRAALCAHWLNIAAEYGAGSREFLREFRAYWRRHQNKEDLLTPWDSIIFRWNQNPTASIWWSITDVFFNSLSERRLWPLLFDAIAWYYREQETSPSFYLVEHLAVLLKLTRDTAQTCHYLTQLKTIDRADDYLDENILQCAYQLDAGANRFAELVLNLERFAEKDYAIIASITLLSGVLSQTDWPDALRDLVLAGELQNLREIAQRVAILQQFGVNTPIPTVTSKELSAPAWSQHYPAEFHELITQLAEFTPQAQRMVSNLLQRQFPEPSKLQQEIAALEQQLQAQPDNNRLLQRLSNLRQRLQAPTAVSPRQRTKLTNKLRTALHRALLNTWRQQLDQLLIPQLIELVSPEPLPEWLLQPRQLAILEALLGLSKPVRELGLRLLRRRCQAAPWNLLDDPANQAFIERMQNLNINLAPWLKPPAAKRCQGNNKRWVTLSFEQDPLEIFYMGGHFNTCLSPGAINFFSVFANAADINKQVIYARDVDTQKVVGRCLLALTEQGGLLTFEPYCHDSGLGFAKLVAELVEQLAAAMKTTVLLRGEVACLVAPDWYDDGSHDLCNRFQFLQLGSALRRSLLTIDPDDVVAVFEQAFEPLTLNELTLPLILELSEFDERPQLIIPLLPYIQTCQRLDNLPWYRLIQRADKAGANHFVHWLIHECALPYLFKHYDCYVDWHNQLLELLIQFEPSLALRLLRQTRERAVRSDDDETDSRRRDLLAEAHQALGRTQRAQRLRRAS